MSHPLRSYCPNESSYEELLSKCGVSTLEIQRARTLAIEAYKSIHQMTPIYIQEMFNIKVTLYDIRDPCRTSMPKAKTTHDLKGKCETN